MFAKPGEHGVARDDALKVFESVNKVGCPGRHGDGLAMEDTGEGAEFVDVFFKMRDEAVVEASEADEGAE